MESHSNLVLDSVSCLSIFGKERVGDSFPEVGDPFLDQPMSPIPPPMVPKRLLDIPNLRKMIAFYAPRLPAPVLVYWEEFFKLREAERKNLCGGCEELLAQLIGLKISGDKEEKNKKTAEKQSILDGLEEHRKNECAEVGFFNTYFLC